MENSLLEKMDEFFENRIDSYDSHMMSESHIRNGYKKIAELIPENTKKLLEEENDKYDKIINDHEQ